MARSKQVEEAADAAPVIADEVEKLANAAERLMQESGLTEQAVLVLLKHKTGMPVYRIKEVLDALPELRDYLK